MKFFRVIVLIGCGFIMHPEYALPAGPTEKLTEGLRDMMGKLKTLDKVLKEVGKLVGPSSGLGGKPAAPVDEAKDLLWKAFRDAQEAIDEQKAKTPVAATGSGAPEAPPV